MSAFEAGWRGRADAGERGHGGTDAGLAAGIVLGLSDPELRLAMARYLALVGFRVRHCGSVAEMDKLCAAEPPDLVIVDSRLPDGDGLAVTQRLRQGSDRGIIMLTSPGSLEERIIGLSLGADLCLAKPVHFRELEAVVRSLGRRLRLSRKDAPRPADKPPEIWGFDEVDWRLLTPLGHQIQLTGTEYQAIRALVCPPGRSVHRDQIAATLGKCLAGYDDRSIDAVMARLRRKVKLQSDEILPIRAARGIGYAFTAQIERRRIMPGGEQG